MCDGNLCKNGGICNIFICLCVVGWIGMFCEVGKFWFKWDGWFLLIKYFMVFY